MHAFLLLFVTSAGLGAASSGSCIADSSKSAGANRAALIQLGRMSPAQTTRVGSKDSLLTDYFASREQALRNWIDDKDRLYPFPPLVRPHDFIGAPPIASGTVCKDDSYQPSYVESQWAANVLLWTGNSHCSRMSEEQANSWVYQNEYGNFDTNLFSVLCRKGKVPQFIEPLAGIMRDPRYSCYGRQATIETDLFSVDWLVFPDGAALTSGGKARFYDAGGTTFHEALMFMLKTYQAHGIVFDEVFVWEFQKQGTEAYWKFTDSKTRAFWEPRLHFYDGIPVTNEAGSKHNPVHRIFESCAPEDYCVFKLDIDTPPMEQEFIQQFLDSPSETTAKLDELFFEHHVEGVMQDRWATNVLGTFADSYRFFGELRKLGVRAHSWI